MNLERRIEKLEKVCSGSEGARPPLKFALTPQEHAAFALSRTHFFNTFDAEYADRIDMFWSLYSPQPVRQTDPAEMMVAMRNTVHGDPAEIASTRQRYRTLMDSVFERCGFNPMATGA